MWLGIKPKRTLDLLILNISKGVYVCLAVDVYTDDQHKRLIHKLQAKEKNYDLLPMKCLERIRSAPIKSKRGKQLWRFLSAKDEESTMRKFCPEGKRRAQINVPFNI